MELQVEAAVWEPGGAIYAPQVFLNGSYPSITLMNVFINDSAAIGELLRWRLRKIARLGPPATTFQSSPSYERFKLWSSLEAYRVVHSHHACADDTSRDAAMSSNGVVSADPQFLFHA